MPVFEYPSPMRELIAALRALPSIGPRAAERLALFLVQSPPELGERLASALRDARHRIRRCHDCGYYSEAPRCAICEDADRDRSLWCIVEQPQDVFRIERAGGFRGLYHVLGGRLSPLDGVNPEHLTIDQLRDRVLRSKPTELILALGADVEGETTTLYLAPILRNLGAKVTRLATGLPAGGGLEYADSVTLGYAIEGRREMIAPEANSS